MSTTSETVEFDRPDEAEPGRVRSSPEPDRQTYRNAVSTFRSRRVVAASLVSAGLAIVAIVVAIQVISQLVDRPLALLPTEELARLGRETSWSDPLALIVSAVAGLLGLLLLGLAILPGRARVIPLATELDHVILALRPGALTRHSARAAEAVPGVERASASLSGNRLLVSAASSLRDPGDLAQEVRQAVSESIDQFAPLRRPQINVDLRNRKE